MTMDHEAITLAELCRRITRVVSVTPGLTNVWLTAETSDLRVSGGHCYMELIQKDPNTGTPMAKCRAVIWASAYARLGAAFYAATGTRLRSDMKIMARVSVSYHAVYGFSLVINDIDPDYTVGDLARRRNQIIARLRQEGVYDLNRSLPWVRVPNRIAIVSARGAAGYGDFMKHLHLNPYRLRFDTTLFEAALQGERTSASIISALEAVMERVDDYDCVVIIRGGGAVSDLASFDDYELAANVAQFPLPVVVGIGHERDVTVLDYVANTRVKTPTAAAELLIGRMADALGTLRALGEGIQRTVADRIAGQRRQLAYCQGTLPEIVRAIIDRNRLRVGADASARLADAVRGLTLRRSERLDALGTLLSDAATALIHRRSERLKALGEILDAISPEATLRRGYSITRYDGRAVTDAAVLPDAAVLTTTFAKGEPVVSKKIVSL